MESSFIIRQLHPTKEKLPRPSNLIIHPTEPDCKLQQVFSLNELNPEDSNLSELQVSPVYRTSKLRSLRSSFTKGAETSTNFSNSQSGKNYEEVKSSMGSSITEFKICTVNSPECKKNICSFNSYSPCFAFCSHCKKHVNSEVEFLDDSGYLNKIFRAFTLCCGRPEWFNKVLIHKCPLCNLPFICDVGR